MSIAAEWFAWLCVITGAAVLFAVMLGLLGKALVSVWRFLQVWHTLILCVTVQLHGREYKDRIFWEAVAERAKKSAFAAQNIADFALEHKPEEEPDVYGDGGVA